MSAPGDAPVLDPAVLEMLRTLNEEGEPDVVAEVLQIFLADAPARVAAIAATAAAGDARGLERAAHGLKGSAGNIGARVLQGLCKTLEDAGRDGRVATAPADAAALAAEFDRVRLAIGDILRS